jgi:hypothetical protein
LYNRLKEIKFKLNSFIKIFGINMNKIIKES